MNCVSKLWVKTKFYISSIIEFGALITATLYSTVTLYSMIFLYAYQSSEYLISFFLTLSTVIATFTIFTGIAHSIWFNRNNMKNEVWSSILDNPKTVKVILESFELRQRIGFLTQYDRLGDTALRAAVRSNNTKAIKLILDKLSSRP